ncbi:MAG: hypothetical protein HeimC2_00440 [Candidatus Heimdallarchaeota archaeon LC_2]|nr:MAG: hypothetical protein HeimC2_00440 [Candidatus Heimdallarchaeota archaeon LC_2]
MVKINEVSEIDKIKLEDLFQKRGHGVTSKKFWTNLKKVLLDPEYEIHQCNCGELSIIYLSAINQYPRDQDNNIQCKVCGGYGQQTESSFESNEDLYLAEIFTDMFRARSDNEITFHYNRAIEKGRGIVPIRNIIEFQIGLSFHLQRTAQYENDIIQNQWTELTKPLLLEAMRVNSDEIKSWYHSEELVKKRQAIYKIERIAKHELNRYSEVQNYPFEDKVDYFVDSFGQVAPLEKKIRKLLSFYRELFELALLPHFLMNLIDLGQGKKFSLNPFKGKKFNYQGRRYKVRPEYTLEQISVLVQNENVSDELGELLSKTYNNKIRNDVAHSQYRLDTSEKFVYSEKYNHKFTFDEIEDLVEQINLAELTAELLFFEYGKKLGAFPKYEFSSADGFYWMMADLDDRTIPQIVVFQYYYFNLGEKIPKINITLKEKYLEFELENLTVQLNYLGRDVDFLDELLIEKEIDVNLVRIAPKMNRYVNEWNEKEFPDPVTVNGHEFYIVSSVSSMQKIENILLRQIFDHLPN